MIITLSLLASIDVFKSGADGYNCYRIPSMITLPGGRIFAFAEGRLHDCYDGPLPPWHTVWGEYETIRWHVFALPSVA